MKNHAQNVVEKLFPNSLNFKIEHISRSIVQKFMKFDFIVCQVEGHQNILKLSCISLALYSYNGFIKSKNRSETSLTTSFSPWFLNKIVFLLYSINGLNFISCGIGQYLHCNCWLTMLRRHKF